MNREIKFRAWHEKNKEMVYEKPRLFGDCLTSGDILNIYDNPMQFTGLHDKNGKEIYEGDIIKFHTGVKSRDDIIAKVIFRAFAFGCVSVKDDGEKLISGMTAFGVMEQNCMDRGIFKNLEEIIEVIGNIHENPELL